MAITAIWGPPRSGKTTLAIDLAFALSRNGQSVCLISPELYSELSARLNLNIQHVKSLTAACRPNASVKESVCPVSDLFFVLAAPTYADSFGEELTGSEAKDLLNRTEPLFDAVLVDCPSQPSSAIGAWALNRAERVLLLTGCQSSAAVWYNANRRAVSVLTGKSHSVCVQASSAFDYRGLAGLIRQTPEVWVPHVPDAEQTLGLRRTLYESGGKAGKAYTAAIDVLCGAKGG